MIGDVWEWTATEFDGYPGFSAYPYREYSEVFFAGGYRVLRGGSWATRPRVATSTFRNWDLPQRRQIFSGLRIARDAVSSSTGQRAGQSWLTGDEERSLANDVLDGLTKPFKELSPKHLYDARGSELFERICALPEYYPTRTELADPARAGGRDRRPPGGGRAGGAGGRGLRQGADPARRDARSRTLRRYMPLDVSESVVEAAAAALADPYPGMAVHGVVGDFERHLEHVPDSPDTPRLVALLGGTIGNFPPGTRRGILAKIATLLGAERDRLLLGCDLLKDSRRDRGRLQRLARGSPPSSTATCSTSSTASSTPTSGPRALTTWPSSTASTSGWRCACGPPGRARC